jgi:hypothetical protein
MMKQEASQLLNDKALEDRERILSGELRGKRLLKHLIGLKQEFYDHPLTYIYMHTLFGQKVGVNSSYSEIPRDGFGYAPTRFCSMVSIIEMLSLRKNDVFIDLGSGRGLFINMIGLIASCQVKGIESNSKRVADSRRLSRDFGLDNVKTIKSDVIHADISDGTVFYMFNPFGYDTVQVVLDKISAIKRKVRVATFYEPDLSEYSNDFKEIKSRSIDGYTSKVFVSK